MITPRAARGLDVLGAPPRPRTSQRTFKRIGAGSDQRPLSAPTVQPYPRPTPAFARGRDRLRPSSPGAHVRSTTLGHSMVPRVLVATPHATHSSACTAQAQPGLPATGGASHSRGCTSAAPHICPSRCPWSAPSPEARAPPWLPRPPGQSPFSPTVRPP